MAGSRALKIAADDRSGIAARKIRPRGARRQSSQKTRFAAGQILLGATRGSRQLRSPARRPCNMTVPIGVGYGQNSWDQERSVMRLGGIALSSARFIAQLEYVIKAVPRTLF